MFNMEAGNATGGCLRLSATWISTGTINPRLHRNRTSETIAMTTIPPRIKNSVTRNCQCSRWMIGPCEFLSCRNRLQRIQTLLNDERKKIAFNVQLRKENNPQKYRQREKAMSTTKLVKESEVNSVQRQLNARAEFESINGERHIAFQVFAKKTVKRLNGNAENTALTPADYQAVIDYLEELKRQASKNVG